MDNRPEFRRLPPSSVTLGTSDATGVLYRLLTSFGVDPPDLSVEVSQSIQARDYGLGDDLLLYEWSETVDTPLINTGSSSAEAWSSDSSSANLSSANLYIVDQGRVRVLCQGPDHPRWVTAQVLEADEGFGFDHYFIQQPLTYRAIAASDVRLIVIPASSLESLLTQYPVIQEGFRQQVEQRRRIIFFKCFTSLGPLPSYDLGQLVAHMREVDIPPNVHLNDAVPPSVGRYWLKSGEIVRDPSSDIEQPVFSPIVGSSWGYSGSGPELSVSGSWRSKTAVTLYTLSADNWALYTALVPDLNAYLTGTHDEKDMDSNGRAPRTPTIVPRRQRRVRATGFDWSLSSSLKSGAEPPVSEHSVEAAESEQESDAADVSAVLFPKPIRRQIFDLLRRYPWVEQQSSSDCGAACLSMISRYWGKRFPLNYLREQANVGPSGATLKRLAQAAETLGFHARSVRASMGRIAEQVNPWIAHWDGNHYVVVYRVHGDQVTIADPALGCSTLSQAEFMSHWTGYALLLTPTEHLHETEVKQASLGRYMQALLPYRALAFQVIVVSILIQLFGLVSPLFTQIILDRVVVQKSLETLNVFAVGLVLFGVWGIAISSVRQYLLSYFANRIDLTLISGFIRHTVALPLKFFEARRVGDILTRVQENQKIQRFLIGQVVLAWLNFVTGFVYLGLMLYYNWQLTLLVLGLVPPIVIVTLGATPFLRRLSRAMFKEVAEQNSSLVELITGISAVKSAGVEQEFRWGWEETLTRQLNMRFRTQKFGIGLQALNGLINAVGGALLLWFGARLVIQNQLTIGQFVAFNMMMGHVISPVLALANLWDELQEILISVERLNDVFETTPEEIPGQPLLMMPKIKGDVVFENVTFRYEDDGESDRNTLQNISFRVSCGQTIAIVGRSGSGKTTLVKLLQNLYLPNQGKITLDGLDLRHVSPQSLRSQIGVVPQDCFLFSGTILDNITLHRSGFGLKEAIEAAKLAEAHPFIQSLPLGYRTQVGERGSTLSGGQRQRIAIARALLGQPPLLILDEATSSLDTESERRFQRNLAQVSRNRTTFIIAHRLSTVRNADQIIVIDRGIIVEQGSHDELIALEGLYYHLAQQQLNL